MTRPRFSMGVVGVVLDDRNRVLLVEHVFHPYLPWGLPGGWVERHEDPVSALRRELDEELGMTVEIGPILAVQNEHGSHVDLAYLCRPTSPVNRLSFELLDHDWFDAGQLPRTHAFHRLAIHRAWELTVSKLQTNEQ
ncbi:MAG: NUDIX hydrolase [Chloroflexota bacterium]